MKQKIRSFMLFTMGINFIILPLTMLKYGFDFWKLFIHMIFMIIPVIYVSCIDLKEKSNEQ
jgi:hypothetical protein